MAHVIGYLREITQEQLDKFKYYKLGDMIGQNGLEQKYELELHGSDGINYVAFNKVGQKIDDFITISKDVPARNGLSLNLTIDIGLQELAESLLQNRRGAVVAIDPNNGEIIICASKPDYHLSLFSGRVPPEIYNALRDDKEIPLLPRA
jgi:penicillin-binding protein 2